MNKYIITLLTLEVDEKGYNSLEKGELLEVLNNETQERCICEVVDKFFDVRNLKYIIYCKKVEGKK